MAKEPRDVLLSFRFKVEIGDIELAFRKVSGLKATIEKYEYREGNNPNFKHKIPGMITYDDVTLERGIVINGADNELIRQWLDFAKNGSQFGDFRTDVKISVMDRAGTIKRIYTLKGAWISDYSISDLDAESSDGLIESIVISYNELEITDFS